MVPVSSLVHLMVYCIFFEDIKIDGCVLVAML